MKTIRTHELTFSPSIVAYLKMLVMLGTLRHQLSIEYDLAVQVRRFFSRLIRQQATAILDPRLAMDRLYGGAIRLGRAIDFVEFLESQQAFITDAQSSLFGFRRRMRSVRRRLISLGMAALLVGAVLYIVLANPDGTQEVMPREVPYPLLHITLLVVLLVIVGAIVQHIRGLGRED